MKKIKYEEPVGRLSELDDLYLDTIKKALDERNIYGILFYNNPPRLHPAAIVEGDNEPFLTAYMLKYENGKINYAPYDEDHEPLELQNEFCFTKEQYEQGALADLDQQNGSNWGAYFADESVWLNLKDLFNDEWDENNFSGARAYVYDDIYNSICRAINDCADEE